MERVVLFDGECNFCDKSVQFIIKRDPAATFKFASLQGDAGTRLLKQYNGYAEDMSSFVLIENGRCYYKSTAALRICGQLPGLWKTLYGLLIVPRSLRDAAYGFVARNRYRWFGKKDSCILPSPEVRSRFLD